MYIYQAITYDEKCVPKRECQVREFPTEKETLEYLEKNGGSFRNILDNVEFRVRKK